MKKYLFVLIAIMAMTLFLSCEEKVILPENDYPTEITSFVKTHFPDVKITSIKKEEDDGKTEYEVVLANGVKLEFNADKKIKSIESNVKLPDSVIPDKILAYVQQNYANLYIISWKLDDNTKQSVKLNNGLELEFDLNGNFIKIDD